MPLQADRRLHRRKRASVISGSSTEQRPIGIAKRAPCLDPRAEAAWRTRLSRADVVTRTRRLCRMRAPVRCERIVERDIFQRTRTGGTPPARIVSRKAHSETRSRTLPVPRPRIVGLRIQLRRELRDREVIGVLFVSISRIDAGNVRHSSGSTRMRPVTASAFTHFAQWSRLATPVTERCRHPLRQGSLRRSRRRRIARGGVHRRASRRADMRDVRRQRFLGNDVSRNAG